MGRYMQAVKRVVQRFAGTFGLKVIRLPHAGMSRKGREYETILPSATYSPWNTDAQFLSTYELIKHNTLVDIYRCWELWTLVQQTAKCHGAILEVGVWRGGTGALMAVANRMVSPVAPVYLCDTFAGVVKARTARQCL